MFWSCPTCNAWGIADTATEAAVEQQLHQAVHIRPSLETAPEEENEDTVLNLKYVAWGITVLLGLLSGHWHALAGVVPFAAIISLVLTHTGE